ncbi:MAG TPA: hypothetical protein PLB25_20175, partial [Rhodoferax sp.]|nr:hypothetical protein [Rhodoferax sp.]
MATGPIHHIIDLFNEAFRGLSVEVSAVDVEKLANLVQHAMTGENRTFHNTSHALGMCEGMKPLQVLAALFHDVVYCQIDGGLPALLEPFLEGVTSAEDDRLILQKIAPADRATTICADVFGFRPGQVLPLQVGMNEFLSAVVAVRVLQRHLRLAHLIAIAASIEMTIPFRTTDADGHTAAQALARRVRRISETWHTELSLSQQDIAAFVKTVVTDAVLLANRDTSGFTEAGPRQCLTNTWLLLKEANASLATHGVHSLVAYREALMRMDVFFSRLDPVLICQTYDDQPGTDTLRKMGVNAGRNVQFSRDYLAVEIAFVAILEALALCTGSDCPAAILLGDMAVALPDWALGTPGDPALLDLLDQEHLTASINDLTASPLKPLMYRFLGHAGTEHAASLARQMFA